MKKVAIIVGLLCPLFSFGMDRLAALSMIESGNNDRMVGRQGEISRYQILKREWRSVTNSSRYTDPQVARAVTLALLEKRFEAFKKTRGRSPTNFEVYALWNAPAQALSGRVSPVVAERCRRYSNLCAWTGIPVPPATPVPAVRPTMLAQAEIRSR